MSNDTVIDNETGDPVKDLALKSLAAIGGGEARRVIAGLVGYVDDERRTSWWEALLAF